MCPRRRNGKYVVTVLVLSSTTVVLLFLTLDLSFPTKVRTRGSSSNSYLYPKSWRLIDIPAQYLINNEVCGREEDIFLLLLITSHARNIMQRKKLREEFNSTALARLGIRRIFLLAKIRPKYKSGQVSHGVNILVVRN
jgi:hypothetical protein